MSLQLWKKIYVYIMNKKCVDFKKTFAPKQICILISFSINFTKYPFITENVSG